VGGRDCARRAYYTAGGGALVRKQAFTAPRRGDRVSLPPVRFRTSTLSISHGCWRHATAGGTSRRRGGTDGGNRAPCSLYDVGLSVSCPGVCPDVPWWATTPLSGPGNRRTPSEGCPDR
jgi:hypothetical protein